MSSLYEPSVRSSTWSLLSRRLSRRFTTLEGWREVGLGVYTMSSNIRLFALKSRFDTQVVQDTHTGLAEEVPPVPKILPQDEWVRTGQATVGKVVKNVQEARVVLKGKGTKEEAYHVFSVREKWSVVAVVGVLGLFPGLSAGVYLPALNAVARVCIFLSSVLSCTERIRTSILASTALLCPSLLHFSPSLSHSSCGPL